MFLMSAVTKMKDSKKPLSYRWTLIIQASCYMNQGHVSKCLLIWTLRYPSNFTFLRLLQNEVELPTHKNELPLPNDLPTH